MSRVVLGAVLAVLLLASACGGGDEMAEKGNGAGAATKTEAASPKDVNSCELLTAKEIEVAVGNPVEPGTRGVATCSWVGPGLEDVNVTVNADTVALRAGSADAKTICAERRALDEQQGTPLKDVSGLGTRAWWWFKTSPAFGGADSSLTVCMSEGVLSVDLTGARDEATMQEAAEALARKALDRI